MTRQPTELEKIFANEVTYKGLISKIFKQLIQLNNKKAQTTQQKNGQFLWWLSAKESTYQCRRHGLDP